MIKDIKYKLEREILEKPSDKPRAAVLIGILNFDEYQKKPELIYTQRSGEVSTHSKEVSFPGGKQDKSDKNLFDTATREANEEINLNPEDVNFLGQMNYVISRHDIEVSPIVVEVNKAQDFLPNEEIADIFTVPIEFLRDHDNITRELITRDGSKWLIPTWYIKDQ